MDLIGCHGQTVYHEGGRNTLQLGEPAILAERTGTPVVSNFRARDIAAGGQGAPLVPYVDYLLFHHAKKRRVVLNIGGIGNITVIRGKNTIAFDTGPGNVLMDLWIMQHRGRRYDADGAWAASGTCNEPLLQALLDEPYLALPPPKSTGRDLFHDRWLAKRLSGFGQIAPADVQATLAQYTAVTLAQAIHRQAPAAEAVYVCGGGACNRHLMDLLAGALAACGRKIPDASAHQACSFRPCSRGSRRHPGGAGSKPAAYRRTHPQYELEPGWASIAGPW